MTENDLAIHRAEERYVNAVVDAIMALLHKNGIRLTPRAETEIADAIRFGRAS